MAVGNSLVSPLGFAKKPEDGFAETLNLCKTCNWLQNFKPRPSFAKKIFTDIAEEKNRQAAILL